MLRKLLLPLLATAALAGCATDYQYRGGNGDYYYGQPGVEYRNSGPGGFYGEFGLGYGYGSYGFGATYFYDRYGRLVYGYPNAYYGSPYYGNGWYPNRPPRGDHHGGHQHDPDNRPDRLPPWRDLGRLQQRDPSEDGYRNRESRDRQDPARQDQRPRAESRPDAGIPRSLDSAPAARERREPSSRMGGAIDRAVRTHARPVED
ncbi:hypothetical protein [Thermomonas sp.]